jgi:type IV secretion system protein VirB11
MVGQRTSEHHDRLMQKLKRDFGALEPFLHANNVVEIMRNPDGSIFIEYHEEGVQPHTDITMTAAQAEALMGTIASLGRLEARPGAVIECELPSEFGSARFEGTMPPITHSAAFSIRTRAIQIYTLDDYVHSGIMTLAQAQVLKHAIRERKNILVSGSTGSGKTTLCNALLHELAESDAESRVLIIEDTRELQCSVPNKFDMCTTEDVDQQRLLKAAMRLRPDRIIVGEVRDHAALTLLKAWNTGHPGGLCTLHANNPAGALIRLEQLIAESGATPSRDLICEAVDIVVQINRDTSVAAKRRVTAVSEVITHDASGYVLAQAEEHARVEKAS